MDVALLIAALFVGLQVADIWTTWAILSRGGRELNPLMALLFRKFGFWPSVLTAKFIAIALVLLCLEDVESWELLAVCGVYVLVVGSNLRVLRRCRSTAMYGKKACDVLP